MKALINLVDNFLDHARTKHAPVIDFKTPEQLIQEFSLDLSEQHDTQTLPELLSQIVGFSTQTNHPYFCNQLYAGADEIGILGNFLATLLNTNTHTYEVALLFTLMEKELIKQFAHLVGWKQQYDGLSLAGGTVGNLYGLMCARHMHFPDIKRKGMRGIPAFHIYTSQDSHYSIKKNAIVLGLGLDDVIQIQSTSSGVIDCNHLKNSIEQSISEGTIHLGSMQLHEQP